MSTLASYTTKLWSLLFAASMAIAQDPPASPAAQRVAAHFNSVNQRVLEMARDFPADKYNYRQTKEMRTFGEVIIHIASGNVYVAKAGRGDKVNWDELDAKSYPTKAQIVAELEKSIADAGATLKAFPEGVKNTLEPWIGVMEHSAEHYGLLVAYYRANALVPPASRPKSK